MAASKDRLDKNPCKKCNKIDNSDAVVCEGVCGGWLHMQCAKISAKNYKLMTQLANIVTWYCDDCKPKIRKILDNGMSDGALELMERIVKVEEGIYEKINKLEKNITSSSRLGNQTTSYAEAASTPGTVKGDQRRLKSSNAPGIIIKPTDANQTSNETKKEIKSNINPSNIKAAIKSINDIKHGGIIIKTDTEESNKKLILEINKKFKDKYTAYATKKYKPKIKIVGLPNNYTKEELIRDLCNQNSFINETDEIDITYTIQTKKKTWIIFAEVSGDVFHRLMDKRYVNVGWDSYPVFEDIYIKQCTKCQQYGHKREKCTMQQPTCKYCGEQHSGNECNVDGKNYKCANCEHANDKYNRTYNSNHATDGDKCEIRQSKIDRYRGNINYSV